MPFSSDNEVVHLACAAKFVHSHMFGKAKPFTGFPAGCQKESVPSLLLEATTPAALSITQLLKFSNIKHKWKQTTTPSGLVTVSHSIHQETPVPTYLGLMLHAHTCKRDLVHVDRLYILGMSISYDRVLHLSAQMGSSVCEKFHREHVVSPPKLWSKVFTSYAVDNLDHNPTSTTS